MLNKKLISVVLLATPMMFSVTGCSSNSSSDHTIRILNLEDYIYINDPKNGYDLPDLVDQFEEYANEKFGFNDVQVIYELSDTNESEYNDLLTGRIKYDLVCTSDYMLQKFVREDLVVPLDLSKLENYTTYASSTIKNTLDSIPVKLEEETVYLKDYAVGYMWGTLGLLINPEFSNFQLEGAPSFDELINDAQNWDILWNSNYKNAASIKNSMRDTYAVALMHAYDEDLATLRKNYLDGEISASDYNKELSRIFNLTDEEKTLPLVKEELNNLKGNVFGLEVDSGKQDIISGKIGLNLAWSGDAVYSMDQAEDLNKVSRAQELYYAVPENGSNVWFDGWAMPKNEERKQVTTDLALEFLNFISDPKIATLNMDYTGYTSFIGGDSILDLVIDWYDVRTYLVSYEYEYREDGKYKYEYFDVYYEDPNTHEETLSEFSNCHFEVDNDPIYDEVELYYYDFDDNKTFIYEEDEEGNEIKATYNSYFLLDDYEVVDLTYFFNGTLDEHDNNDAVLYSDCYLPFEGETGNISVGRQFFCQYPSEETILRCAIMADYGDDNIKIVKLWEEFKSNPLPTWAIILLISEIVLGVGAVSYLYFSKRIKKLLRLKRKPELTNKK